MGLYSYCILVHTFCWYDAFLIHRRNCLSAQSVEICRLTMLLLDIVPLCARQYRRLKILCLMKARWVLVECLLARAYTMCSFLILRCILLFTESSCIIRFCPGWQVRAWDLNLAVDRCLDTDDIRIINLARHLGQSSLVGLKFFLVWPAHLISAGLLDSLKNGLRVRVLAHRISCYIFLLKDWSFCSCCSDFRALRHCLICCSFTELNNSIRSDLWPIVTVVEYLDVKSMGSPSICRWWICL